MIVFPAIDLRGGKAVRLTQGKPDEQAVYSANPVRVAERWASGGAEWLHIVNLDGALGVASRNMRVVGEIMDAVDLPVQFGGGLRSFEAIEDAFEQGITRIVLGTIAMTRREIVELAVAKFGGEAVAVGIDARDGRVATHGWQNVTDVRAVDLARRLKVIGVEWVVYTDIERDGMMAGPNIDATVELARETGLRVIASGGVASLADIEQLKAHESDGIAGVIIGKALYAGTIDLEDAIEIARA